MASSSGGSATTIASLHPDIIETHILTKFDVPSLASAASTSQLLRTLCNKENLWKDICDSTWDSIKHPLVQQTISSFPGGYRSFVNDSFRLLHSNTGQRSLCSHVHTSQLISAVDICYGNDLVHSKVVVTNTDDNSFLGSLFSVDMTDCNDTVELPLKYQGNENECMRKLEEKLTLSWIVIDPALKRAGNVSSLRPVSVRPYWDGSSIKVVYATVLSGDATDTSEFVECRVIAIFDFQQGKDVQLRELSFCVVDMVKSRLNGKRTLRILQNAMECGERKKENGQGRELYLEHLEFKRKRRDDKQRRQKMLYRIMWFIHIITCVFFSIHLVNFLCFTTRDAGSLIYMAAEPAIIS
ncbi:F-box protein At2g27310-like [Apium graveolens]|uniref:F-box protein At2g27310-like n=1 Tax=Apium graveolens TaxID=4045 RepID=UPI003D795748